MLSSCKLLKNKDRIPAYINDTTKTQAMIAHEPIHLMSDSTRTIVVYNVIEKEDKRFKITDETIRLLIADFFGTITTVITVWQMQSQP